MRREDLIPPISARHIDIVRRVYGDGILPETHAAGLSDVAFLDLQALIQAGLLAPVKRGRYRGYRVTGAGIAAAHVQQ